MPVTSTADAHPCAQFRAAYDDCFNRWYSDKFSKGHWDKMECVAEWDKYRACLLGWQFGFAYRVEHKEHLEDKHLRRILLEAEGSAYSTKSDDFSSDDADGDSRQ